MESSRKHGPAQRRVATGEVDTATGALPAFGSWLVPMDCAWAALCLLDGDAVVVALRAGLRAGACAAPLWVGEQVAAPWACWARLRDMPNRRTAPESATL